MNKPKLEESVTSSEVRRLEDNRLCFANAV